MGHTAEASSSKVISVDRNSRGEERLGRAVLLIAEGVRIKSLVLYRECGGAVVSGSKVVLIAAAFPIQLLAGSRLYEPMGIGLSRAW